MQQSTESQLISDTEVRACIYRNEQLRQAGMLRQIDRTAAGIKNSFTICVTALVVLFLFTKVVPHMKADASGTNRPAFASAIAATDLNKTQTLAVISHEHGRRVTDPVHNMNNSPDIGRRP